MILTPSRKIIDPNSRFRTLADVRRRGAPRPSELAINLMMDLSVRDRRGKLVGHERVPCKSFTASWMEILRMLMLTAPGSLAQSAGATAQTVGVVDGDNLYCLSTTEWFFEWLGPVIGVGTTTPTPGDTKMEKQIMHGTAAPNLSVLTGTTHASVSTVNTVYDNGGNPLTSDQYNHYIIEITSGVLSGEEREIFDTVDSSTDYFTVDLGSSYPEGSFASEPDGVTYKVKTYGMMTHGSVGISAPADDGSLVSSMAITRTFTNGCGETIDVTEFGLKLRMKASTGNTHAYILAVHDVKGTPVSIANGQELTLTYTLACEA